MGFLVVCLYLIIALMKRNDHPNVQPVKDSVKKNATLRLFYNRMHDQVKAREHGINHKISTELTVNYLKASGMNGAKAGQEVRVSHIKAEDGGANHTIVGEGGANYAGIEEVFGDPVRVPDYIPSIPVGSAAPHIPHIIHQTWDDENVPARFSPFMRTWTKLHPDWEYWFWTPTEVRRMLQKHYPQYLAMYGDYKEAIFKANLMRYFIMHKYGGVYADLDLESLRPLDNWTMDNECIMSQNHHVHAYVVGNSSRPNVMITFLASRPGHPYFKRAIEMLPLYKDMPYRNKLHFSETVYRDYLKSPESQQTENSITVTHPDYFLPTYDRNWQYLVRAKCKKLRAIPTSALGEKFCDGFIKDFKLGLAPKSFSYTNHHWVHVVMWTKETKALQAKLHINTINPNALSSSLLMKALNIN